MVKKTSKQEKLENLIKSLRFLTNGIDEYTQWLGTHKVEDKEFKSTIDVDTNWEGIFYAICVSNTFAAFSTAIKSYISKSAMEKYKFPFSALTFDRIRTGGYARGQMLFLNYLGYEFTEEDIKNTDSYKAYDSFIKWYEIKKQFGEYWLSKEYMNRAYGPYLTVLERRYRKNWNLKDQEESAKVAVLPSKIQVEVVKAE